MKNPFRILKNEKGVALLVAIFSVMLISFIAVEVSEESMVEYFVANNEIQQLKAYYAARAGVDISLLRVKLYRQAVASFGDKAPMELLNQVWSLPFAWPPPLPEEALEFDKVSYKKAEKESLMDGSFVTTIKSEGSKIDLNDLASPSKALQQSTKDQLIQIVKQRLEGDDDWARDNQDIRPEEVVENITNWVKKPDENSGAEASAPYRDYPSEAQSLFPPARPFRTLDELKMVAGVTPEIYDLLSPRVTVHGSKGIQVNNADEQTLRSLDEVMTEEVVKAIIDHRKDPDGGPFKDEAEFYSFIEGQGANTEEMKKKKIPLIFDSEYSFSITSTGYVRGGKITREIIAIVYDFDKVKERLTKLVEAEKPTPTPSQQSQETPAATATPKPTPTPTPPPGRPRVVYWYET